MCMNAEFPGFFFFLLSIIDILQYKGNFVNNHALLLHFCVKSPKTYDP